MSIETIAAKLDPSQIRTGARFHGIVAYILDQHDWTEPEVTGLWQTSDGFILAGTDRDPFANEFIGSASDLDLNLRGLAKAAGLTKAETALLMRRRDARVAR